MFNSIDAVQYFLVVKYQTNLKQHFEKSYSFNMCSTKSHTYELFIVFLVRFLNNDIIILICITGNLKIAIICSSD